MKKIWNRKFAFIGMTFHIIYFVFAVLSLGDYEYSGHGVGKAFAYWIYAIIFAFPTVAFYLVDAITTFIKRKRTFNIIKLVVMSLLIPALSIGTSAGVKQSIIWNTYFISVFVFQFISLFIKQKQKE